MSSVQYFLWWWWPLSAFWWLVNSCPFVDMEFAHGILKRTILSQFQIIGRFRCLQIWRRRLLQYQYDLNYNLNILQLISKLQSENKRKYNILLLSDILEVSKAVYDGPFQLAKCKEVTQDGLCLNLKYVITYF